MDSFDIQTHPPCRTDKEELLTGATEYSVVYISAAALVVILFATVDAYFWALKYVFVETSQDEKRTIWLRFARWLVVGMTFRLVADILETSITTGWDSLIQLSVIVIARTMLNYFLERDLAEMREQQDAAKE